jgi:methionyl-tRNA formyltransferase
MIQMFRLLFLRMSVLLRSYSRDAPMLRCTKRMSYHGRREGMAALAQPPATSRNVHKISKNDGIVDWHASAVRIANMVRAYQPWPRAFTYIPVHGKLRRLQITAATACPAVPDTTPGQILPDQRDGLRVATGDGVLLLRQVIPEGGKGMDAVSFLRGNPVMPGCILE